MLEVSSTARIESLIPFGACISMLIFVLVLYRPDKVISVGAGGCHIQLNHQRYFQAKFVTNYAGTILQNK